MDLAGYERAKFELSGVLQTVITHKLADEYRTVQDRLRDLLARLAEDRFNLVVAGRFNRGKSSLMNAILGLERLPTGIMPLTSVITTVSYGTTERVIIKYQQRRLDSEIPLKELPQYVTQEGNPGNSRGIATANIELPADILRRGFFFVDTPGLGSVIAENAATTNAFLPEADALLLVTSFESPLSEDELSVLERSSRRDLPVFVVLNKHDLVALPEREQAVAFVRDHLVGPESGTPIGVFSVSARDALTAKLSHDEERLLASGVPALEDALVRFLLERKHEVFLSRMCTRIEGLIDDLPASERREELRKQMRGLTAKYREKVEIQSRAGIEASITVGFHAAQLRPCEVCAAVEAGAWDFLARFQYEIATDPECQDDFARRSGFCCYHTFEYQDLASPFGTCSGYPPLLERLASALRRAVHATDADMVNTLGDLLARHETCPMCNVRDQAEARAIADVAERVRLGAAERERLSALCLPHLRAVARAADHAESVRLLLQQQALALERTAEDMRRFTLKQSAARRHLQTKEEQTASARALTLVAGRRNVNFAAGHSVERASDLHRKDIHLAKRSRP
jgi:GTP-binding protein EngB required for normal cell division